MKRMIKFRGRVKDSNTLVYGSFVKYDEEFYNHRYWIYPIVGDINYPVDPKSVVQFVGYDERGNEVYEGDIIVDVHGYEIKASLRDNLDGGRVVLKEKEQ